MDEQKEKPKSKRAFRIIIIILIVIFLILGIGAVFFINQQSIENKQNLNQVVLENPMKKIVQGIVNQDEPATQETIIQEGIKEFNEDYINYILLSLGVGGLHSFFGYGNPIVEMNLDNEIWSSEIIGGGLRTMKTGNNNKDLIIAISKEEAVKALLSPDIAQFIKDSVINGRTQLEMIAGKPELLSKGYLDMYKKLSG